MIKVSDLKHLHIELSSNCNARCPLCPRNFWGYPYETGYVTTNLSLEKLQSLLSVNFVKQLDEILINGNYGDFVMNDESVEIISWLRKTNPSLKIHISTNGGARNKEFWQALGSLDLEISFCIDGLADTHHIYRQDTTYNQVIKNATTFIKAGGRAVWTMTKFAHSEHQIIDAEKISTELGFAAFNVRDNNRNRGPIYNREGKKVFKLNNDDENFPDVLTENFINQTLKKRLTPYKSKVKKTITCEAKENKSLYISAEGKLAPCCYVKLDNTFPFFDTNISEFNNDITIEHAVTLFNKIEETFESNQLYVCQSFCGK